MANDKMKAWGRVSTVSKTRESPNDFIAAYVKWQQENPERKVTPKAFAIIRGQHKEKKAT